VIVEQHPNQYQEVPGSMVLLAAMAY